MMFSEATDIVAMTLRQRGAANMSIAMDHAERLVSFGLTQLEAHRSRAAKELNAAIARLDDGKPAAVPVPPASQLAAPRPVRPGMAP
jgi:hypothetical protein